MALAQAENKEGGDNMKIEIEIPDGTICGFVNYVYHDDGIMMIGTTAISTEMIEKQKVICKGADGYVEE